MPLGLSAYARRILVGESLRLDCPVLVWELPRERPAQESFLHTETGPSMARPRAGEPVVFELRKGDGKSNAFAMGVTLGRTENNDLVVDDNSISRFHAYFQRDPRSGVWRVVDAESKNGTFLALQRLKPNRAESLTDRTSLRFGDVSMVFLLPEGFVSFLQEKLGA